jgi:hypothetical protein
MPDFAELKQRQAAVWSAGAFENIAESIQDMHVALVDALGPKPGEAASVEEAWETFSTNFGPLVTMRKQLDSERWAELERAMLEYMEETRRPDGRSVDEREFLLVTGIRREERLLAS